jgi:hypothetical protein
MKQLSISILQILKISLPGRSGVKQTGRSATERRRRKRWERKNRAILRTYKRVLKCQHCGKRHLKYELHGEAEGHERIREIIGKPTPQFLRSLADLRPMGVRCHSLYHVQKKEWQQNQGPLKGPGSGRNAHLEISLPPVTEQS